MNRNRIGAVLLITGALLTITLTALATGGGHHDYDCEKYPWKCTTTTITTPSSTTSTTLGQTTTSMSSSTTTSTGGVTSTQPAPTSTVPTTTYFVEGYCAVKDDIHRPLADLDSSTRADSFILNGVDVGPVAFGIDALFGVNQWSNGEVSGTFTISDENCAPQVGNTPTTSTPTTIVVDTTGPTVTPTPSLVVNEPPTRTPEGSSPAELPFTGPEHLLPLGLIATGLVGGGLRLIRGRWGR